MSPIRLLPITYRDFYDVPRMFVVENGADVFLFDCAFDEDADGYPSHYTIYKLACGATEAISKSDWRPLPKSGAPIGTVNVADVKFDPTNREFVDAGIFDWIR